MRHSRYKYNIGTSPSHRKALIKNLTAEIIDHGKVKTTLTKCRAVKPYVEKLITLAKNDTVANRRLAQSRIGNKEVVQKLFTEVGPKFKERPGGYTRINKVADGRVGDNAKLGFISFVE